MNEHKVIACVPCKAESRRVPQKNRAFVGGLPLWLRKCQQLRRIDGIHEVWVDTDSDAIASLADAMGFKVLRRSPEVNGYDGHQLFAWEVSHLPEASVYVQALCTAPFLSDGAIADAVASVVHTGHASGSLSAVCVKEIKEYGVAEYMDAIPDSDTLDSVLVDCMCLYVVDGQYARDAGKRHCSDPMHFPINEQEAFDIDYPDQLEQAQTYALGENERECMYLRGLKPILSSALLSDTLVDLGFTDPCMGDGGLCCSPTKVFGRACTMRLEEPMENDVRSIYDALQHYSWCMPGNVLCVQAHDGCAYFGELNASLALRAGAQGLLIDGLTRDSAEVAALGFPVWSKGGYPFDCREELVCADVGAGASMYGRWVNHGDLIFADADGCVSIPRHMEDEVLQAAIERSEEEVSIRYGIACGATVDDILSNNDGF